MDNLDLCRIVLSYKFNQLELLYVLRSDCLPIKLLRTEINDC